MLQHRISLRLFRVTPIIADQKIPYGNSSAQLVTANEEVVGRLDYYILVGQAVNKLYGYSGREELNKIQQLFKFCLVQTLMSCCKVIVCRHESVQESGPFLFCTDREVRFIPT